MAAADAASPVTAPAGGGGGGAAAGGAGSGGEQLLSPGQCALLSAVRKQGGLEPRLAKPLHELFTHFASYAWHRDAARYALMTTCGGSNPPLDYSHSRAYVLIEYGWLTRVC